MSSSAEIGTFDYVVVGGGTAGAIVAARLSEDPDTRVCLIEAGPSDVGMDDVLLLRRWLSLLEGPIDLAYPTTLQPRGNAHIVHSRAAVLGGCSSHNTQIFFKPLPGDWQDWVDRGAAGWEPEGMEQYYDRLQTVHQIVAEKDRNPLLLDWIPSAAEAAGVQANPDWNAAPFHDGVGFLDVGYDPETGVRSSSSVAYLHPIMGRRPNLTILTDTLGAACQPRERPRRLRQHGQRRGAGRARDHRLRRLDRHAAPAAAVRHRAGGRSRRAGHRGAARPARRRREPDRPPGVDHHLGAQGSAPAAGRDGGRLRAVRQPLRPRLRGPT